MYNMTPPSVRSTWSMGSEFMRNRQLFTCEAELGTDLPEACMLATDVLAHAEFGTFLPEHPCLSVPTTFFKTGLRELCETGRC